MSAGVMQQRRPIRRADVWVRQSGGENAVIDPDDGSVHLMNQTAMAIWQLCDGETDTSEMIDAICQISGLHAEVVAEDVERILTDFEEAGLVRWLR